MATGYTATEQARKAILDMVSMPLNGIAKLSVVAKLLAWLGGQEARTSMARSCLLMAEAMR